MNVTVRGRRRAFRTVSFDRTRNEVVLIEQRALPHSFELLRTRDFHATAAAITDMVVRGAGAIGATAAYGLAQGAAVFRGADVTEFWTHVEEVFAVLAAARPTAVDPVNAMRNMLSALKTAPIQTVVEAQDFLHQAAAAFADEDAHHCAEIGRHGVRLIRDGMRVLTHCNAGWLAFVDHGSATAPFYAAQAAGRKFHVFCDETRPRCQGAALTAWELAQQGIAHDVIADNAAGFLMQRGEVDLVIVGSDRTLGRTGEVANKIGTYTKAVLAARHKIPFYVAIPLSTIDWEMRRGSEIPIEERSPAEVLGAWGVVADPSAKPAKVRMGTQPSNRAYVRIANPTSTARNPGFDVTPPDLIAGIITPIGIFKPKELWKHRARLGFGSNVEGRKSKVERRA